MIRLFNGKLYLLISYLCESISTAQKQLSSFALSLQLQPKVIYPSSNSRLHKYSFYYRNWNLSKKILYIKKFNRNNPFGSRYPRKVRNHQEISAYKMSYKVGEDWNFPTRESKYITGLYLNNSLTGKKTEFIPENHDRRITWYGCGPTVYDAAHMGHARNYVTFDIIRRIFSDYLNYDVFMVMNITDIDDKIINRSIELNIPFLELAAKWEKEFFLDMSELNVRLPTAITRVSEHIPEVLKIIEDIIKNGYAYVIDDDKDNTKNKSVYFDTQAFNQKKITIDKGATTTRHIYGRMAPSSVNISTTIDDNGNNNSDNNDNYKRHVSDFALWKKCKVDEPSWPSPWGCGRPGWHIECSAMASTVLPYFPIDIHSGGIDLRFPHHDNELAQSEAAKDKPQWVNYFLHSGHLHLEGLKMSKSLKNFITIKEFLKSYNHRHIRFMCLYTKWDQFLNFNTNCQAPNVKDCSNNFLDGKNIHVDSNENSVTMMTSPLIKQAIDIDKNFIHFFTSIRHIIKKMNNVYDHNLERWDSMDFHLNQDFMDSKNKVREHILDNINTPDALLVIQQLMSQTNIYLSNQKYIKIPLIKQIALYILDMLKIFGVVNNSSEDFTYGEVESSIDSANMESCVDSLAAFRAKIREEARAFIDTVKDGKKCDRGMGLIEDNNIGFDTAFAKNVLKICDDLRDVEMEKLGILLQDRNDNTYSYRICGRQEMIREQKLRQDKEFKKLKMKEELLKKNMREMSVAPNEYFKILHADEYKTFDAEGVPLTNKNGEEISKIQRKKLAKFLEKRKKVYEKGQLERQEAASHIV